ncbi:dienelactone hydrolase family protein [Pseudomonas saponiphila]|uniref:dienelactone hydrolase family protein n=1 Tax=Pseudomonas saponiphila TaxID=556534 RepID=UPI0022402B1A|nr:dienelactone hydrolase family protein [Pseudomonas saponiphila]
MRLQRSLLLAISALLVACTSLPSPDQRREQIAALADAHHWRALELQAGVFRLQAYEPHSYAPSPVLTLYIEGDGLAWLNTRQPSPDPTPLDPMALRLAMAQPTGNAAYLGRPCQYLGTTAPCHARYWTDARFSEEVVTSLDQALDQLKARAGAQRLIIVGYSGGGALALLLAARRSDVEQIVTVAGNLDPAAWTRYHRVAPLGASLNPAALYPALAHVPQLHLVGDADSVMPAQLAKAFIADHPIASNTRLRVISGYDHHCCWAQDWARLWREQVAPLAEP